MNLGQLWSNVFGKRMTQRLLKLLLPDLIWNQEIYGSVVRRFVNQKTKWLDVGCGWRMLGEDLIAWRDSNGTPSFVANNCPHRGASLFFGDSMITPAISVLSAIEGVKVSSPSVPAGEL